MRIQNQVHYQTSPLDFPLTDITTLFMPSLSSRKEPQMEDFGHTRINSENLAESEYDVCISCGHVCYANLHVKLQQHVCIKVNVTVIGTLALVARSQVDVVEWRNK
jgi:hypothetical protein